MRYKLKVSACAQTGREAEYDHWYRTVHMHEVLALPGFLSCERYRVLAREKDKPAPFVAYYDVETEDPEALLRSLFAAGPNMQLTDALDSTTAQFEFLEPLGGSSEAPSAPPAS